MSDIDEGDREGDRAYSGETKFRVGDLVCWSSTARWSTQTYWGTVTKVTRAGTVTVKPHGYAADETFRRSRYGAYRCTHPGVREKALYLWSRDRPETEFVSAYVPGFRLDHDVNIQSREVKSNEKHAASTLRAQARELETLADWLDRRPE